MDEKTKLHNALYMDGVKKKQLSVRRMCDNGFYVTFQFKDCDIWKIENGKLEIMDIRTQNNVSLFDGYRVNF